MRKIVKYASYLLFLPIWYIVKLIPRKQDVWVFGAWYGNRYADNSKALFEHVVEYRKELTAIWLTRNRNVVNELKSNGYRCYHVHSLKGIYYSLICGYYLVSSGKRDVNYLFTNGAKAVQLWHGSPIKKISLDDPSSNYSSLFYKIFKHVFPFVYEFNYDLILANSELFAGIMMSAFGMKRDSVLVTGCPRNDYYFSPKTEQIITSTNQRFNNPKLLIYLPTFRENRSLDELFKNFAFETSEFTDYLEYSNSVLFVKPHYVDRSALMGMFSNEERIIVLSDNEIEDLNLLVKDCDVLLTDYSSIFFDFLLTEKPIIFTAFDFKEYVSVSRELYFDYQDLVPGPITENWAAVRKEIDKLENRDDYAKLRTEKKKVFNTYSDSKNCNRVLEALLAQE